MTGEMRTRLKSPMPTNRSQIEMERLRTTIASSSVSGFAMNQLQNVQVRSKDSTTKEKRKLTR